MKRVAGLLLLVSAPAWLSALEALPRERYVRAERSLPWHVRDLVSPGDVEPHWIDGSNRFWYVSQAGRTAEAVLVDAERHSRQPLFDHQRLAVALTEASGTPIDRTALPLEDLDFHANQDRLEIAVRDRRYRCDLRRYACSVADAPTAAPDELPSPDGRWAAFVRDHNVYVRPLPSGPPIALTQDGAQYYDYGTRPEHRLSVVTDLRAHRQRPPALLWSPDSKRLVAHRLDQRDVQSMHLIESVPADGSTRPILYSYKYPLPGDRNLTHAELVVLDVESRTQTALRMDPMLVYVHSPFDTGSVWWNARGDRIYIVEAERYWKALRLKVADALSGDVRTLVEERGETYVEPHATLGARPNARVIGNGAEVIWYSERDGWGHLYLYDASNGALKGQITRGQWLVRNVVRVDEKSRMVYFTAGGREPGRDPYFTHLYRVGLDGTGLQLLTPEDATHEVAMAPSGEFFIDRMSRVDSPPSTVLRSTAGRLVQTLDKADVSQLLATGWHWPERFQVKARDGATDLYGIIIKPSNFDPAQRYPVIDDLYPGPQSIRTPKTFPTPDRNAAFWQSQALADLGFIVITLDGMGTAYRSKAFHDFSYGNLQDAGGLEDRIGGMRQLAVTRPYMDLSRVGIFGHSAGGFASAHAILTRPDFYKVAVSSAGNHDQRLNLVDWGEIYQGPVRGNNYDAQDNATHAANLRGKLMLAWGDLDDNVHFSATVKLIDALEKNNKDVDLVLLPNRNHAFGTDPYFIRKRWDYFVRHLLQREPPEYKIEMPALSSRASQ